MLPEMGEFDRATVVNAKFYHLQAEHTYNVNFWGEVDNLGGNSNADLTSVETVSADFEDGTETFRTREIFYLFMPILTAKELIKKSIHFTNLSYFYVCAHLRKQFS